MPGRRPSGTRSRVLCQCGPFRVRDILVLPVVVHADLHPRCLGSSTVQRLGSVERGDAPTDHRDQLHGRQHRDDVRTAAEDRRIGSDGADHAGAGHARYQHNAVKALATQLGITPLFLPSYSPNLNLIERLWKFINHDPSMVDTIQRSPTFKPPSKKPSTVFQPDTLNN